MFDLKTTIKVLKLLSDEDLEELAQYCDDENALNVDWLKILTSEETQALATATKVASDKRCIISSKNDNERRDLIRLMYQIFDNVQNEDYAKILDIADQQWEKKLQKGKRMVSFTRWYSLFQILKERE